MAIAMRKLCAKVCGRQCWQSQAVTAEAHMKVAMKANLARGLAEDVDAPGLLAHAMIPLAEGVLHVPQQHLHASGSGLVEGQEYAVEGCIRDTRLFAPEEGHEAKIGAQLVPVILQAFEVLVLAYLRADAARDEWRHAAQAAALAAAEERAAAAEAAHGRGSSLLQGDHEAESQGMLHRHLFLREAPALQDWGQVLDDDV
mmetsp:Transcript_96504/g.268196  ORF Transcript_96504/g.268196 Transcript_96504/m.268196 type:complete len:200 (-) Transcript_96504:349-948(-)